MSWWEGVEVTEWHRGWKKEWDPKFARVSLLVGWSGGGGGTPGEILKTKNAGEAIPGHFAVANEISNLPELCLFADVWEEKVRIYSMLLNVFETGRASLVCGAYRLLSRRPRVRSSRPAHSFVEILRYSLPCADSKRAVVSYWRKSMY